MRCWWLRRSSALVAHPGSLVSTCTRNRLQEPYYFCTDLNIGNSMFDGSQQQVYTSSLNYTFYADDGLSGRLRYLRQCH
jgi:hypothetical protein